ncbi:MAG TPA: hypothetical protein PKJ51_10250 [Methanothrix sp.]|nr:hypothetical protein [Methanothrix sp.]
MIELYVFAEKPEQIDELLRKILGNPGADLEYADADTIRASLKDATQEILLGLLEDGWSFSETPRKED